MAKALDRLLRPGWRPDGGGYTEAADVEAGFDALADLYYAYWGDHFHPALFAAGDDPNDLAGAYERTHRRYFDQIGGASARSIGDLGCGGGALSLWMAGRTRGEVVGVDRSRRQLEIAEQRRTAAQAANLRYIRHDLLELSALGERFEAAICLDAACYLPDRRRFLKQAASSLVPGARLLVVDWCRPTNPTSLQRNLILDPMYAAWAIDDLETVDGYGRSFAAAELELLAVDDLSALVAPEWERGYRAALQAIGEPLRVDRALALGHLVARYRTRVASAARAQFQLALLVRAAADAGLLRYMAFLARRPVAGRSRPHSPKERR